jgi:RNA polymerase sigma-70 factor (ECF subfamily)
MAAAHADPAETALDEALVKRLQAGDREAFDLLYDRYFTRVHRFIGRRMSNQADADETTQEVFINLFSSIQTFRGDAPFAAWMFGVARRTLASRFKRRRHDMVPLGLDEPDNVSPFGPMARRTPDPHEAYEASERLDRMESAARDDLNRDQWKLFQLHHLENRSIQDIAVETRKSEDAVKSHLYRARKLLLAR